MNASFPRFDQAATYKQISPLLRVSFEFIDWETDLVFLHGIDAQFYVRLFTCLQTLQTCTDDHRMGPAFALILHEMQVVVKQQDSVSRCNSCQRNESDHAGED